MKKLILLFVLITSCASSISMNKHTEIINDELLFVSMIIHGEKHHPYGFQGFVKELQLDRLVLNNADSLINSFYKHAIYSPMLYSDYSYNNDLKEYFKRQNIMYKDSVSWPSTWNRSKEFDVSFTMELIDGEYVSIVIFKVNGSFLMVNKGEFNTSCSAEININDYLIIKKKLLPIKIESVKKPIGVFK